MNKLRSCLHSAFFPRTSPRWSVAKYRQISTLVASKLDVRVDASVKSGWQKTAHATLGWSNCNAAERQVCHCFQRHFWHVIACSQDSIRQASILHRSEQLHIASCSISTNSVSQKFGDVVLLKLTCHIQVLCATRFSL